MMDAGWQEAWRARVERWIAWQPTARNRSGLDRMVEDLGRELEAVDFELELARSEVEHEQPVIVARRAPRDGTHWIGLLSHYDVELVCHLEHWQEKTAYDRVGLDRSSEEIAGVTLPTLTLPARPGASMATIVEVAAREHRQRGEGVSAVRRLDARLDRAHRACDRYASLRGGRRTAPVP